MYGDAEGDQNIQSAAPRPRGTHPICTWPPFPLIAYPISTQNDCNVANIEEEDNEENIKQKTREYLVSNHKLLSLKNEICKILLSSSSRRIPHDVNTKNKLFEWKAPIPDILSPEEPLEVVANARNEWDKRLRYQLRTLSVQQKRPLVQMVCPGDSISNDD